MSLGLTSVLMLAALAVTAFCGWRGARPPDLHKGPRLAPWRFLMITFAALSMLLMVHLVNLLGVTTGRP